MKSYFLPESDFESFVGNLLQTTRVIGPVAKKHKFVFAPLTTPQDLRLDYDVTILPPKKAFFPPHQPLVDFDPQGYSSRLEAQEQVLFGVHFYDIKAIDMLDELFRAGHEDRNYLARREATTIVASGIEKVNPRAFYTSVGTEVEPQGHDAFLTHIDGGYLFEPRTPKGQALVAHGAFQDATTAHEDAAEVANRKALDDCPRELHHSSREVARRVLKSFDKDKVWQELSHDCFSCGTCNTVCPTCYCFDVQDTWNLDQQSGTRTRIWDGCLLEDFAQVSLGAGATENFREARAERFRHRIMRKAAYLNEKLGGPACVGCGRCSVGCVPDIADPVKVIKRVMEG